MVAEKLFTIKDLERFSGIKAHTIRIWELRYKALSPIRNQGNIRHYTHNDVFRLLQFALLQKSGYKISKLAGLSAGELEKKLKVLQEIESKIDNAIHQLILFMYRDIEKFEEVLDSCVENWGIDAAITNVIIPFLEKAGLLYYKDKTHETHFVITAIRKKIISGIEHHKTPVASTQSALMFLQEGEHYDLYLLYITYLLKQKGIRVLYLGTDISSQALGNIIKTKSPDLFFTYIPYVKKFRVPEYAGLLNNQFPGVILNAVTVLNVEGHKIDNINFIHYKMVSSYIDSLVA